MDKYAVLGNPIKHSKSPFIHTMFAADLKQDMVYDLLLCQLGDFAGTVDNFIKAGGKGLNITVPFKEDAFHYADKLSERAEKAGAVNTLRFNADGTVYGDNTDGAGFVADFVRLGWQIKGKKVLVVGAGGASRGIMGPLLDEKPASLVLVNRTIAKAEAIKKIFQEIEVLSYDDLTEHGCFDIVINATSGSLKGVLPPLPVNIIGGKTIVYDLMYTKGARTIFLDWAEKNGAAGVSDGLGMLVGQAAESFYIWRGKRPDPKPVLEALRKELA